AAEDPGAKTIWNRGNKMKYVEKILEKLKEKEAFEKKFRTLDEKIISTLSMKEVFENLISGLITIFDVPYIWLSAIEDTRLAELIRKTDQTLTVKARVGFVTRKQYFSLLSEDFSPVKIQDPSACTALFPENGIYPVKSMAACPVLIDGETAGCIIFGDLEAGRFSADAETEMLDRIMVKMSLCLSNVAAHEELRLLAGDDDENRQQNRVFRIASEQGDKKTRQSA
ncbi:MAG: hypothetical protein ACOC0W_07305, partial [Desulfosalsimonas sp.]